MQMRVQLKRLISGNWFQIKTGFTTTIQSLITSHFLAFTSFIVFLYIFDEQLHCTNIRRATFNEKIFFQIHFYISKYFDDFGRWSKTNEIKYMYFFLKIDIKVVEMLMKWNELTMQKGELWKSEIHLYCMQSIYFDSPILGNLLAQAFNHNQPCYTLRMIIL